MKIKAAALALGLLSAVVTAQAQVLVWYVAAAGGPFGDGCESLASLYAQMAYRLTVKGMNLPPYAQKVWETPDDLVDTMSSVGADVSVRQRGDGWVLLNWEGSALPIVLGKDGCQKLLKSLQKS